MIRKIVIALSAAFIAAIPLTGSATEGFYGGVIGGVNLLDPHPTHGSIKTRKGYTAGAVAGYKWCQGFSVEAEGSYRRNHYKSGRFLGFREPIGGHLRTWSFMANAYYEFPLCGRISPYAGGGIGVDYVHEVARAHHIEVKGCSTGFAYQLMAGACYEICEQLAVTAEYKFHDNHEISYDHSFLIGLRKYFKP